MQVSLGDLRSRPNLSGWAEGLIWPWQTEFIWPWDVITGEAAKKGALIKAMRTIPLPSTAPPAPQTEAKMRTWTPEDIAEAQAQQTIAYEATMKATADGGAAAPVGEEKFPWTAVLLVGGGVLALLLVVRRRR